MFAYKNHFTTSTLYVLSGSGTDYELVISNIVLKFNTYPMF